MLPGGMHGHLVLWTENPPRPPVFLDKRLVLFFSIFLLFFLSPRQKNVKSIKLKPSQKDPTRLSHLNPEQHQFYFIFYVLLCDVCHQLWATHAWCCVFCVWYRGGVVHSFNFPQPSLTPPPHCRVAEGENNYKSSESKRRKIYGVCCGYEEAR